MMMKCFPTKQQSYHAIKSHCPDEDKYVILLEYQSTDLFSWPRLPVFVLTSDQARLVHMTDYRLCIYIFCSLAFLNLQVGIVYKS